MDMRELAYDLYKADWLQRDGSTLFADSLKAYYKQYSVDEEKQTLQDYLLNNDHNGVLYVGFEEFVNGKYKDANYIRSLLNDEDLFSEYLTDTGIDISEIESQDHTTEAVADKMELTRFMRELCDMIYDMDKTDVIDWVAYAKYLQEYKNTTFEKVMIELYLPLSFVNNNFEPEIINQVMKNQIPADEIINCAVLYAAGYGDETISEIGDAEVLVGGYIPLSDDEQRTLSLIGIENNPNCIFIAANTGHETIMKCMKNALAVSVLHQSELETVLENPDIFGVHLRKISNPKLMKAMIKAVNNSTAFDVVTVLNTETNTVKQYGTENLTTEKIMKLFSEESGGQALGMNGQQ